MDKPATSIMSYYAKHPEEAKKKFKEMKQKEKEWLENASEEEKNEAKHYLYLKFVKQRYQKFKSWYDERKKNEEKC